MSKRRIIANSALIGSIIVLLALVLLPMLAQAAPSSLPPRPTAQPTSIPRPGYASPGTSIELHVQFPPDWPWDKIHWQDLWTVVQWQDAGGNWHDVAGWQGSLDAVMVGESGDVEGVKTWWVAKRDLGAGPFRWVVKQSREGKPAATSEPFYLPCAAGETVPAKISLLGMVP